MSEFLTTSPQKNRPRITGPIIGIFAILLFLFGVLFTVNWIESNALNRQEQCVVVVGSDRHSLAPDQTENAAIIAAAGLQRGLEQHEIMIALATAMQESKIRNINYGDSVGPDSRGLFQQRPSMGWGTEEEILDPWYAANRFYQELETIPDYQNLPLTEAAQAVQRSAFPDAYAKHEPMANTFSTVLTTGGPGAMTCTLRSPDPEETKTSEELSQELLNFGFGIPSQTSDSSLEYIPRSTEAGWRQATWALALAHESNITQISFNGLAWNRTSGNWTKDDASSSKTLVISLQSQ